MWEGTGVILLTGGTPGPVTTPVSDPVYGPFDIPPSLCPGVPLSPGLRVRYPLTQVWRVGVIPSPGLGVPRSRQGVSSRTGPGQDRGTPLDRNEQRSTPAQDIFASSIE